VKPPYPSNVSLTIYYEDEEGFYPNMLFPGTLYWSGTLKYDSLSYNPFAKLLESLDKGWKQCLDYKGKKICGMAAGSGGSSANGIIKMNGPLIQTVILTNKSSNSKRDLYLYISDPVNIEDYIVFE
jgi:hypothetical protein